MSTPNFGATPSSGAFLWVNRWAEQSSTSLHNPVKYNQLKPTPVHLSSLFHSFIYYRIYYYYKKIIFYLSNIFLNNIYAPHTQFPPFYIISLHFCYYFILFYFQDRIRHTQNNLFIGVPMPHVDTWWFWCLFWIRRKYSFKHFFMVLYIPTLFLQC